MANDTSKLIIGNGDFSLIIGATSTPVETEYDATTAAFGNITSVAFNNESTLVEHMGSYNGVKIRDDVIITAIKNGFKLTCDEFDNRAMRGLFFAGAGTADVSDATITNYTPLSGANTLRGYARLRIYDARGDNNPRITWKNFSCLCKLSTQPTFDGENYGTYEVEVHVLGDLGTVAVKSTDTTEDSGGMI